MATKEPPEVHRQISGLLLQRLGCIDYSGLPPGLRVEMADYLDRGIPPCGFLRAVLCNDLLVAVLAADPENAKRLSEIVRWLSNNAAPRSYGDPELVAKWLRGDR